MLDTSKRKESVYFTGEEIEQTPMIGQRTLFVVGIRPAKEIEELASKKDIKHVYFGTSQSFNPSSETLVCYDDNTIRKKLLGYIRF